MVGTAGPSEAASRRSRGTRKAYSTTVKNQKKSKRSTQASKSQRSVVASSRSKNRQNKTASHGRVVTSSRKVQPKRMAKSSIQKQSRTGTNPRPSAAKVSISQTSTLKRTRRPSADDLAVRLALATRQRLVRPRGSLLALAPATVKDPPAAKGEERTRERMASSEREGSAPDREGVLLARNTAVDERSTNDDVITEALRNRGKPYIWGGASRHGFDCSGFVCYVFFKQKGIKLPHSASGQARYGKSVGSDELLPGDLVFFRTYRAGISHVGIYIGDNRFIHAANRRKDVRIDNLSGYYGDRLKAARRLLPAPVRFSPADLQRLEKGLRESSEVPSETMD